MAKGCQCVLLFAVVVAVVLECAAAAEYIVGDGAGWTKEGAPDRYVKWAAGKNFVLGDVLVFNFKETPVVTDGSDVTDRTQQVREVEKETYEACEQTKGFLTDSEQLQFYKTSPAKVTLNRTGEYYFACLWSDHCKKGQKIAIKVSATKAPASSGSPPAPAPKASTPATNAPAPKASTPVTNAPAPAAKTDAPAPSKKETAPASNAPASSQSAPSPKSDAPATKEEAPATDMSPPATKAAEPTPAAPANAPSSSTTAIFASAFVTLSSIVMGFIL